MPHGWPKSTTIGRFQMDDLRPRTFHLYRKFTRARHLWLSLRPDWELLRTHMITDQPGNFSYSELLDRLFNNPGRNDLINDTPYQGEYWNQVYHNWQLQGRHMVRYLQDGTGTILVSMQAILEKFEADLLLEQKEVVARNGARGHVTRWKTKQGILRVKGAAPLGEESPATLCKEYEELFGTCELLEDGYYALDENI